MSFPALLDASDDPLLVQKGSVAAVYLNLVKRLDFVEFRRLRAARLAGDMKMRPETVGSALRVLRDAGYIERGDRVLDVFTYRLVFSRSAHVRAEPRTAAQRLPAQARARSAVAAALERGDLVRPSRCSNCGAEPPGETVIEAHHEDYERPLDVEWLCRACHGAADARRELALKRNLDG